MNDPIIAVLITTYQRTNYALSTIRAIKENMRWPQVLWWISDDGSQPGHVEQLVTEIGPSYQINLYDSLRRGVGHGMNHCLRLIFETTPLVLTIEDDWELRTPLDMRSYVDTLMNHEEHGCIRFGYLAPNLQAYLISTEGKLFWRLDNNGETYRFAGHPNLRHKRFFDAYGYYDEGLPPGMTELSMCGKVNTKDGPSILYPAECGAYGYWSHIGTESLADTPVGF